MQLLGDLIQLLFYHAPHGAEKDGALPITEAPLVRRLIGDQPCTQSIVFSAAIFL